MRYMDNISEIIEEIVINYIKDKDQIIDENIILLNMGITSLDFIRIIVELEEKFSITFDNDDIVLYKLDTIYKIEEVVRELVTGEKYA